MYVDCSLFLILNVIRLNNQTCHKIKTVRVGSVSEEAAILAVDNIEYKKRLVCFSKLFEKCSGQRFNRRLDVAQLWRMSMKYHKPNFSHTCKTCKPPNINSQKDLPKLSPPQWGYTTKGSTKGLFNINM